VQFDKRDVETLKLIKLDLLGLGMLAAIDETLGLIESDCAARVDLDRLPEDVPEVFEMLVPPTQSASSRSRAGPRCRLFRSRSRRTWTIWWLRSRSSGRAPSRATRSIPTCAAVRVWSRCRTSIPASSRCCARPSA